MIRNFTWIILLSTLSIQANATCAWYGLYAFPKGSTIHPNAQIVVDAQSYSQEVFRKRKKDHMFYLETEDHAVPLTIIKVNKGMYNRSQAVFQPMGQLVSGKTYTLKIIEKAEPSDNLIGRYNPETEKHEPVRWLVDSRGDTSLPKFNAAPKFLDTRFQHAGCGNEMFANFQLDFVDDSETLVQAELRTVFGLKRRLFLLSSSESQIVQVGHAMCTGAFAFKPKRKYEVRFRLVDSSGNVSEEYTDWIAFESPAVKRKRRPRRHKR